MNTNTNTNTNPMLDCPIVGFYDGKGLVPYINRYHIRYNRGCLEDILAFISNVEKQTLNQNDTVYFTKHSNLHKSKFEAFVEASGLSLTRVNNILNADKVIMSKKSIQGLCDKISVTDYLLIPYSEISAIPNSFTEPIQEDDLVLLPVTHIDTIKAAFPSLLRGEYEKVTATAVKNNATQREEMQYLVEFAKILPQIKDKLVFDEDISEDVNTSVCLDEENFIALLEMIANSDPEVATMGMGLLANTNYKHSKVYILLLLCIYNNTAYRGSIEINNSLRNLFDHFKQYNTSNWGVLFLSLVDKNLNEDERVQLNIGLGHMMLFNIKGLDKTRSNIKIKVDVTL